MVTQLRRRHAMERRPSRSWPVALRSVAAAVAAAPGLAAALSAPVLARPAAAQPIVPPCEPVLHHATAEVAHLARFNLGPAPGREGCGHAELVGVWSPFGLAVMRSGHLPHELRLVLDLPPATDGARYVAWLATPALDRIEALGTIVSHELFVKTVHWNKMVVVVSLEDGPAAPDQTRWSGPVVLIGRSRSALLENLMGHSIFRRAEM